MSTSRPKARWLLVLPFVPRPDHSGGDRRIVAMMQLLRDGCDLDLVCLHDRGASDREYISRLTELGVRFIGYGFAMAARALVLQPFNAVLFEFWHATDRILKLARQLQPRALILIDSVDLHYLREREAARLGKLAPEVAEQTRIAELAAYRSADVTIVVSAEEGRLLASEGIPQSVVIPSIVEMVARTVRPRGHSVLFIGGFHHAPNGLAVEWFHQEIWPLVRREIPDAEWVIAGSNVPSEVQALDGENGVHVIGFVSSTAELLDATAVSIAPLTFGAGMKVKVSEALAAGVPVVTTRWGAQGFESEGADAFLQADDAASFAAAIIFLLTHEEAREQMGERGRALARRVCSVDTAAPVLHALVERSVSRSRPDGMLRRCARFLRVALDRGVARVERRGRALTNAT